MYQSHISTKGRNWLIWFIVKTNLLIFGLLLIFEGLINTSIILIGIGFLLGFICAILIYRDIVTDPHQVLRLMKIQILLWWRLSGPLIKRQPYIVYFPEGYSLQNQNVTHTIAVKREDIEDRRSLLVFVKTPQLCMECNGKRSKPMTVQIECAHCQNGRQLFKFQSLTIPIPCDKCLGIGWVPVQPCPTCKGKGSVWKNQHIRVQIPDHASSGTKLRIPTLGKVDPKNLTQGDLYLKLRKKFLSIF